MRKLNPIKRFFKHIITPPWRVKHYFSLAAFSRIEGAITESEHSHTGEIRFAVEHALQPWQLFKKVTAKQRAIEVFSQLHIWDTAQNNGVLIYLLLADRDFEIIADRGIHAKVGAEHWEAICLKMEAQFRAGDFEAGVLQGIDAITALLVEHYPVKAKTRKTNQLPNKPVVL
jgi:uncharacterized membrane protein